MPITAAVGGPGVEVGALQQRLMAMGVPAYDTPAAAAIGLRALIDHGCRPVPASRSLRRVPVHQTFPDQCFDEAEAKAFLASIGIVGPERISCESSDGVRVAFATLPRPVVLKILDSAIIYKTEIGGVHAELLDDIAIRLAPVDHHEAAAMTADLKMGALFDGWRAQPPVDRTALADVVQRLGDALIDDPGLREIEINPLRTCRAVQHSPSTQCCSR